MGLKLTYFKIQGQIVIDLIFERAKLKEKEKKSDKDNRKIVHL